MFDMSELWGNAAKSHKSYSGDSLLVATARGTNLHLVGMVLVATAWGSNLHLVGMVDGDCAPCGYDSFQGDVG